MAVLAEEEPLLRPGETHQYHALTFGWLVGELIRRTSGRGVDELFAERISGPLGIDAWIGTPEHELPRVAQLYGTAPPPEPLPLPPDIDPILASINERAMTLGSAFSADFADEGRDSTATKCVKPSSQAPVESPQPPGSPQYGAPRSLMRKRFGC